MKKWETVNKFRIQNSEFRIDELIKILLENRGIKTKKEREEFLDPKLETVTPDSVGIDKKHLQQALKRIQKAIDQKEQIAVFGDYDVDGICGAAILWETLYGLGAMVVPYIPHRIDEGYGLSIQGIENLKSQVSNLKLIITVDNGIVANEAVVHANKNGIDVIITDHHVPSKKLPKAHSIVHTTKLCGTGVAYLLAQEVKSQNSKVKTTTQNSKVKIPDDHLALVALATVADLVPLTGDNRILLTHGLEALRKTKRPGIVAICLEAGIDQKVIDTYEIGHGIAPRLNAAGRIEHAMDALRLICTKDANRAQTLARLLGSTNRERQVLTIETVMHASTEVRNQKTEIKKLLFIVNETYKQGVIGLVAGRLVEEFYRPAIVVSKGKDLSKASARSVHGFNIIEFIRSASEYLIDVGGHPMAAGFTVETAKLPILQETLEKLAHTTLSKDLLTRTLRVDCGLSLQFVNQKLYDAIQNLSPFGMGNAEPTFVSRGLLIEDMRLVGKDRKHVKFKFHPPTGGSRFQIDGIGFGLGERMGEFHVGDKVDIVYVIDENEWDGKKNLQLKIKDIKQSV